ncbi:SIR2 family protein [Sphingorhabdus sp. YGSMI21]|uniref:SIR2 family protein n=1 Tax=Sphingorhabdus sp. YGSMI21 TaxID=2077182 RepID=UPI0013DB1250|nr:SIR2 family protein [Sphingorhabdus sp. YGSMI21]
MSSDIEAATQLDRHLRAPRQVWLTGAGISFGAGLPLMYPLTDRILGLLANDADHAEAYRLIGSVKKDLPETLHIEHILSHLGDLIALSERANDQSTALDGERVHKDALISAHHLILRHIRDILKWGYRPANGDQEEKVGKFGEPIVTVDEHRKFVRALYKINRAGLDDQREAIQFVTTNYDTLIEDALALELIPYVDGFEGGAIAAWDERIFDAQREDLKAKAVLTKLHGSIDWFRSSSENGRLFRVRHDDQFPDRSDASGNVVIYPQSTKYMATREDPFGYLFQRLRGLLSQNRQQVLFVCGYSFGDEHIDAIIAEHLLHKDNKTTLVAFSDERQEKLEEWGNSSAGERIFVLSKAGLYRGNSGPFFPNPDVENDRTWWTFSGATNLLENGLPDDVAEAIA